MLGNCPNLVRDSLYVRFAALCLIIMSTAGPLLLSEGGLGLDYGGGKKKCQKIDYVICERTLRLSERWPKTSRP